MANPLPQTQHNEARWFALQVRLRYEKVVSAVLRNKGHREFLPLCVSRRRWSDRIAEVELPLFPGYVFCHFALADRRAPVLTTPGVVRIVGVGGLPVAVDDREIAAIQAIVDSRLPVEPWPYLKPGGAVRIEYGSLSGLEGILVGAKKHHRLVVSVTLLQRSVAVEIDRAWIAPVFTAPARKQPPCWHA